MASDAPPVLDRSCLRACISARARDLLSRAAPGRASSFRATTRRRAPICASVIAVNRGRAEDFFAYTETRAQHACYTIRDYRKKTRDRVLASFPEPERSKLAAEYAEEAAAPDGADVLAIYARAQRLDESAATRHVRHRQSRIQGERATVETARGTRYPFRRRDNGIWGLTLFTAALTLKPRRRRATSNLIEKAASDYERAAKAEPK